MKSKCTDTRLEKLNTNLRCFWQDYHTHFITWGVRALLMTATVGLAVVFYWLNFPYRTIELHEITCSPSLVACTEKNQNYLTNKLTYAKGEKGFYYVNYCKFTDIKPTVRKWYADGLVIEAEESTAVLKRGCELAEVKFTVPHSLPAGKWHIKVESTYTLNPIRQPYTTKNTTNWFIVTDSFHDDPIIEKE